MGYGNRHRHRVRPALFECEPRALLSAIIDLMATQRPGHPAGYPITTGSVATPAGQGPQGPNLVLTPTGTPTAKELKREHFVATFTGTYTQGPGRFSTVLSQIRIKGAGSANVMAHGDTQVALAVPTDPTAPLSGNLVIFDRNLNSNSALGLDLAAPAGTVDAGGRPTQLSLSVDVNESSGTFVEAYGQGLVTIHYLPIAKHTPGVTSQGRAVVKIDAQIYTVGTGFLLANSNINP